MKLRQFICLLLMFVLFAGCDDFEAAEDNNTSAMSLTTTKSNEKDAITETDSDESTSELQPQMTSAEDTVITTVFLPEITTEAATEPFMEVTTEAEAPVIITTEVVMTTTVTPLTDTSTPLKLTVVSVSTPVGRNKTATLTINGKAGTEYSIKVFYSTAASSASGLVNKIADSNGTVTWSWKVGGSTKAGDHKIVITGGGEMVETYFTTTE